MALQSHLGEFLLLKPLIKREPRPATGLFSILRNPRSLSFHSANGRSCIIVSKFPMQIVKSSKSLHKVEVDDEGEGEGRTRKFNDSSAKANNDDDSDKDDPFLMTEEERKELRRKIREVIDRAPDVEEEQDPEEKKRKMEKLLSDYPLVVDEDDPDWPEDAEGWGFNLDQFFNKITIKNVKKEDDEGYDSDKEIVWKDDNYIVPIKDITTSEWEDTVFKDFNPLVILVHNRYKRPRENERARVELEKAVKMFWETGLPSPRCVAIDAVVEQDLVSALKVSGFPEILFTKAGKILHREKLVRSADEWSKKLAFFYYKAVRPSCIDKTVGQIHEKIPSI